MNKIVKKVINNSITIRNASVLLNHPATSNYVNTLQDPSIPKTEGDCEENLAKLNFPSLKVVNNNLMQKFPHNYTNVDAREAISILISLYEGYNENKNSYLTDLKNSNEFIHICKVIQRDARTLHMFNIIRALRILISLDISPNTILIQTLLQLIRISVNNLSTGQIMVVYNILCNTEESPLTKSLLVALPHVFKEQAPLELNSESNNLLPALKFCCTINDKKTRQHIINILLKKSKHISLNNAVNIFHVLCTLPKMNTSSALLLMKIQNKLTINAESLSIGEIVQLLYQITRKYRDSEPVFYNQEIVGALCNAVLSKETTFHQDINVLMHLNRIYYSNVTLLDKIVKKCTRDPDKLRKCSPTEVNHLIKGFIIADYDPSYWMAMKNMLQNFANNADYSLQTGTTFAFNLLSLGCYCPQLLEKVFLLHHRIPDSMKTEYCISIMLKLHWCVKLLYPEYNGTMINENRANQTAMKYVDNNIPSLMENIVNVVGGTEYIKCGLKTKFDLFIDYVVAIQPDGTPMNTRHFDNVTFVEELGSFSDCEKILFLVLPNYEYAINTTKMIATMKMQLKAIKTLSGFHPFVIHPHLWKRLSSEQKTQHLQKAIKTRCSELLNV